MKRNWTWVGFFLAAVLVAGCGGDGGGGGTPDASSGDGGGGGAGQDYFYVVSELKIPNTATECFGLDLDGTGDVVCGQTDCGDGIDNNFAKLATSASSVVDIGASAQKNIDEGDLLLLIRLRGVESFQDDSSVQVDVMLGLLPEGTSMPMLDANGRLKPGQTFDINGSTLGADGEPMASVPARIVGGKLTSDPVDLPLTMTIRGDEVTLVLRDTQIVAEAVSETSLGSSMTMGILGGAVDIDDVTSLVCSLAPSYAGQVIPLLQNYADLEPDGDGMCQKMSAGLGFVAVEAQAGAVRTPPSSPLPGEDDGGTGMLPAECMTGGGA